jgi:uncharacterized protein with GYD domain
MARKVAKKAKGAGNGEMVHVFLVTKTAQFATRSAAKVRSAQRAVNDIVNSEGGNCTLYQIHGGTCDFVSVVTGVTADAAVRVAQQIESSGNVTIIMLHGFHIFK